MPLKMEQKALLCKIFLLYMFRTRFIIVCLKSMDPNVTGCFRKPQGQKQMGLLPPQTRVSLCVLLAVGCLCFFSAADRPAGRQQLEAPVNRLLRGRAWCASTRRLLLPTTSCRNETYTAGNDSRCTKQDEFF